MLVLAGIGHLTFARRAFRAQVPDWVPLGTDATVLASGVAEIALGASLVLADEARRPLVGKIAAAFFVAVFPGNVSQYVNRRTAFGLDTDTKRFARLFFQPALVYWALKSAKRNSLPAPRPARPDSWLPDDVLDLPADTGIARNDDVLAEIFDRPRR